MGKITRHGGASNLPPQVLVENLLRQQAEGATLSQLRNQLNAWAVPHADPWGNPLGGSWNDETTQALLDARARQ
ncbi:hypothetical protein [Streptomyces rochei]|uniref:hypothetical protein n=1 Tax=Streptomyces rochei TaxID=1928 RepID=UPI003685F701